MMPALASSPFTALLFESPACVMIVCAGVAAVLLIVCRLLTGPARRRLSAAGLGLLLLAVVVWLMSWLVVTDRERLVLRTRDLLDLTAPLQAPLLEDMFDPSARFENSAGEPCMDRGRMLSTIRTKLKRYRVTSHDVRELGARILRDPGRGESWVRLETRLSRPIPGGVETVHSQWRMVWGLGPDDGPWRIVSVECTRLMGHEPDCRAWR